MQYLNIPLRYINKSPAQLAAGRQLRDGVPAVKVHYRVDRHWRQVLHDRETRNVEAQEEILARENPSRHLSLLWVVEQVRVQDTVSKLWNRMGLVVEACPHRQYAVRLDGSGIISVRNRVHSPRGTPSTAPREMRASPFGGYQTTPHNVHLYAMPCIFPCFVVSLVQRGTC